MRYFILLSFNTIEHETLHGLENLATADSVGNAKKQICPSSFVMIRILSSTRTHHVGVDCGLAQSRWLGPNLFIMYASEWVNVTKRIFVMMWRRMLDMIGIVTNRSKKKKKKTVNHGVCCQCLWKLLEPRELRLCYFLYFLYASEWVNVTKRKFVMMWRRMLDMIGIVTNRSKKKKKKTVNHGVCCQCLWKLLEPRELRLCYFLYFLYLALVLS